MKKLFIIFLALIMMTGCTDNNTREMDKERYNAYITYYQGIVDEDNKSSTSQCFDVELVVNKLENGTYRYDVIIDNPKVAMYSIKALAVIDDLGSTIRTDIMMPSIGILDDTLVNMVPNLVDKAKNYVEGIDLSLTYENSSLKVGIMVDYLDSSKTNRVREYISLYAEYTEPATTAEGE